MDVQRYKDVVYEIIGAAMEVHDVLGYGLLEPVYSEALHLELLDRGIVSEREKHLPVFYKHHRLEKYYQMDLVVGDVVVELKSVSDLTSAHRTQLFNYLRLLKVPCGILVNFAPKYAVIERYVYDAEKNNILGMDGQIIQYG